MSENVWFFNRGQWQPELKLVGRDVTEVIGNDFVRSSQYGDPETGVTLYEAKNESPLAKEYRYAVEHGGLDIGFVQVTFCGNYPSLVGLLNLLAPVVAMTAAEASAV
ncbi:MAG: hypothetical protein HY000_17860 [Planctomycetes bacterium]|nr:hypothetical protein [Planctomycetota bacterium]